VAADGAMTADRAKKSRGLLRGARSLRDLGLRTRWHSVSAFTVCILASLGLFGCSCRPSTAGEEERLFWEVFVGWKCFAAFLVVLCVAAVLGGPLWGKAVRRLGWIWTPLFVVMLVILSCYVGYTRFGVTVLGHDMLKWGTAEYVNEMLRSLYWSLLVSGITLLLWRPWKLFQMGSWLQAAAVLVAVFLINYLLAAVVYMKFAVVGME
jgi:hypothetical protein